MHVHENKIDGGPVQQANRLKSIRCNTDLMPTFFQQASCQKLVHLVVLCHEHTKRNSGTLGIAGTGRMMIAGCAALGGKFFEWRERWRIQLRFANGLEKVSTDSQFFATFHVSPARA